MRTAPFIITLTGSSGCGKSYVTDRIIELAKQLEAEGVSFKPRRHGKYVTRSYREIEVIDKIIHKKEIDVESVKNIPKDCGNLFIEPMEMNMDLRKGICRNT